MFGAGLHGRHPDQFEQGRCVNARRWCGIVVMRIFYCVTYRASRNIALNGVAYSLRSSTAVFITLYYGISE
jgi:hypothetical protein